MFLGLSGADLLIVFVSLLISMTIHEAMHGFVAHWLGDKTAQEAGRLTLNPLRHIDTFTTILLPLVLIVSGQPPFFIAKPVPFNPYRVRYGAYGVALVGLAGPFTNLALAVLASIPAHFMDSGSGIFTMLALFMQVNIAFFVFNMIPFPPLDGSRLLYAFAPDTVREVMERIEAIGFMAIIVFMLVVFQFIGPFISRIDSGIFTFLLLH